MVDFLAILFVCAAGLAFGNRTTKIISVVFWACFICDRSALWFEIDDSGLAAVTSASGFLAVAFLLREKKLASYGFSGLIACRVIADNFLYFGLLDLTNANNIATAIGYLQLLIILGGIGDGTGGRVRRVFGGVSGLRFFGLRFVLAFLQKWLQPR